MKTSRSISLAWLLLAVRVIAPGVALAEEIELRPIADTSLFEVAPTNNLGAQDYLTCGNIQNSWCGTTNFPIYCRNRALLKFDIAGAVPPGSRIRSVRLALWMPFASQDEEANSLDTSLHRMLVPWVPGTGTNRGNLFPGILGRPAEPGEPCWNFRQWPDVQWGLPGGAPGVDFTPQASSQISGIGSRPNEIYSTEESSGPLLEDIQFWLDNPGANHGWMLKASDETLNWTAKRFLSMDSIGSYPKLSIDFVPPPYIEQFAQTNNQFSFTFTAQPGQGYIVQHSILADGNWTNLLTVPAPPDITNILVLDNLPPATPFRFYRVTTP
jgi:hypothetical protein